MLSQVSGFELVIIFASILFSMGFHEAMHAFTAHWLGDTTARDEGRLTLNPLKHIDLLTTVLLPIVLILLGLQPFFIAKPVPFNPSRVRFGEFGAALIGIVGPLTNFVLAIIAAIILRIAGGATGTTFFTIFSLFIQVNIAFFVFNMIPFPPLDGSRLLYAFAPEPIQQVMYKIESFGLMGIIFFMFLFFPAIAPGISHITDGLYRFLLG